MAFPTTVARGVIRGLATGAADLIWPPMCPVCSQWIESPHDESGTRRRMHPACLDRLELVDRLPLRFDVRRVPVHALLADRPEWFALLHRVKYGGELGLLDPLVDRLARAILAGGSPCTRLVVVPVPDDPRRRRERGASVVGAVARRLGAALDRPVRADLVRRHGERPSQTTLDDDTERGRNVRGAFGVGRLAEIDPDAKLLIVDDQATSGATLREAVTVAGFRGHARAALVLARARRTPDRLGP